MALNYRAAQIQSQAANAPSILQTIWNDIINFLRSIFGAISPQAAPASASTATAAAPAAQVTAQPAPVVLKPAITVEQARQMAVASETNINPRDLNGWMSATGSNWDLVIRQLHHVYLDPSECGGTPAPDLKLGEAVAAAGIGAKIAQISPIAAGGGPVGLVLLGVGAIVGVIQAIFTHHAQAVQRDIRAQCSLIPASNNTLDVIINGVQSGQIKASDGSIAMDQLPKIFLQQAGAAKNNSPYCNGVCGNLIVLRAICFYWKSQFDSGAYG